MEELILPEKPWTNKQIRELRKAIADGDDSIEGLSYPQIAIWYGQIIGDVVDRINDVDITDLPVSDMHVSSRVKTITTLRDKLRRNPAMQLPRIHDIMGVRLTADMSLSTQDEIVKRIGTVLTSRISSV